jgi:hypothetical protein
MAYIRYKDMDYALLPLSEKTMPESLKQLVSDGKLDISAVERFLAQGHQFQSHTGNFVYETMKKIPTTIGIPLQVCRNYRVFTFSLKNVLDLQQDALGHLHQDPSLCRS